MFRRHHKNELHNCVKKDLPSCDTLNIYPSVMQEIISVDREAELMRYCNGDEKDQNKREVYEEVLPSGDILKRYPSGTYKVVSADGESQLIRYDNGDEIEIFHDKRRVYRCIEDGTISTSFPNGHLQIMFPNGTVEECFPNGFRMATRAKKDGSLESVYYDGQGDWKRMDMLDLSTLMGVEEVKMEQRKEREMEVPFYIEKRSCRSNEMCKSVEEEKKNN